MGRGSWRRGVNEEAAVCEKVIEGNEKWFEHVLVVAISWMTFRWRNESHEHARGNLITAGARVPNAPMGKARKDVTSIG